MSPKSSFVMCLSSGCPSRMSHTHTHTEKHTATSCSVLQSFILNEAYVMPDINRSMCPSSRMGSCAENAHTLHARAHTHNTSHMLYITLSMHASAHGSTHTLLSPNENTARVRGRHTLIDIWSLARGDLHCCSWETSAELDQLSEAVQRGISLSLQAVTATVVQRKHAAI